MSLFRKPIIIPSDLFLYYHRINMSETELIVILKIVELSESQQLPSFEVLADHMSINQSEIMLIIQNLISKDILKVTVEKDSHAQFNEIYDLSPLEAKIEAYKSKLMYEKKIKKDDLNFEKVFERFELTFARPMTPLEIETISHWIDKDHHSIELINEALNEAAAHNKLSIKYIDRILLNWKKKNVKTVVDSKTVSQHFKNKSLVKEIPDIPVFDWVNGESPYDK
ncbi:DnaD domain protein [Macrococcus armenti]|uniref:DnaD domain protein n=1 Tax=Macrococcus armenti TaxID=2875764 RepID=A0ABY3ZT15_9STAP|nr:DnaD domain protein [Macrococcus armenti]UOB19642.1 DnaD domain protein [Macrococcus armenti]